MRNAIKRFDRYHRAVMESLIEKSVERGTKYWLRLVRDYKRELRGIEPERVIERWRTEPDTPRDMADFIAKVLLTSNLLGQATFWQDLIDRGLGVWARRQPEPPAGLPEIAMSEPGIIRAARKKAAWLELEGVPPLDEDDAYRFFHEKVPLTRPEFDRLGRAAKTEAFTIAGTENVALVTQVKQLAEDAIREGMTQYEFQKDVWTLFDNAGVTRTSRWHVETVFRTNVSGAYNASRWQQTFESPTEATQRFVPYLQYSTTGAENVCEICEPYNGLIYERDDPVWDTIYPPNHYNCACLVAPVSVLEALDEGLRPSKVTFLNDPDVPQPQKGFAGPPSTIGRRAA